MTNEIRPIVKAAFEVRELVFQFAENDVFDGLLPDGTREEIIEAVNDKFDDLHIVGAARDRLAIAMEEYNGKDPQWQWDANELRRFIGFWVGTKG